MATDHVLEARPRSGAVPTPGHGCRGLARLTVFAAFALGPVGLASGCAEHACAAVEWPEGLTLTVHGLDAFSDEAYEFRIEADGTEVVVAIEFEDSVGTCLSGTQAAPMCSADEYAGDDRWLNAFLEMAGPTSVRLNLHYVDFRDLAGGPEVARIRVVRAGETVADRTFEPDYERDEPNGDGCGVSTRAEAELSL